MATKRKKVNNYYLLAFNEDWADEHNVPAVACFNKDEYMQWSKMKIIPSAQLGNNGDGFEEKFKKCKVGLDFIKKGFVEKTIVDKTFYNKFHKAGLADLSLSNIFEIEAQEENSEEESEADIASLDELID